ncbi:MAG: sugar ABC transporter permease [Armatimonadota bacterium]|jgi:multiple sugar transport system permease protein
MKDFLSKIGSNESVAGYLFILPNFLGFLVFTFFPVIVSLCLSFVDWDILTPPKFVGLANFVALLGFHREGGVIVANDPLFWKYIGNTLFFMLNIPICMAGALVVAMVMNQKLKGIVIFRTIFFLPSICAGVALCLLWKWILNPDYGLLNQILGAVFSLFHINAALPGWLSNPAWAKPGIMLMGFWGAIGGMNMILYLAALQGVPKELYEAAEIDGANGWRKFWAVTMPFISPTTFFIAIMGVISGFQSGFMQAYVMTEGGPAGATTTIDYYIYNNAYQWLHMGYASAIAWFLFIVIFLVTLVNWRFGGKLVHY